MSNRLFAVAIVVTVSLWPGPAAAQTPARVDPSVPIVPDEGARSDRVHSETNDLSWHLSKDVRAANGAISFQQGARGVWYFMESASLEHNPQIYSFLPDYAAPCIGNLADKAIDGLACWRDPAHTVDHAPIVAVNFTGLAQYPLYFAVPPHAVYMHPAPDRFAIVAWKSPLDATVQVTGAFTDLDPTCGNGITVSIDRDQKQLAFGDLANGGATTFHLRSVRVARGNVLYFIVDPKSGDYVCDATMLDLTIAAYTHVEDSRY